MISVSPTPQSQLGNLLAIGLTFGPPTDRIRVLSTHKTASCRNTIEPRPAVPGETSKHPQELRQQRRE